MDDRCLTHLAWADDTWMFGDSPLQVDRMLRDVSREAEKRTGLQIRWDKCKFVDEAPSETVVERLPDDAVLHKIEVAATGTCLRLLGAQIQVGGEYRGE